VEITISADPLYQHLLLTAEKKFWRCVETGEPPNLFTVEPPRPRLEAVRVVDMTSSNAWADLAGVFCRTRAAHLEHDAVKAELKKLMPEDAKEAIGHGVWRQLAWPAPSASTCSPPSWRPAMQRCSDTLAQLPLHSPRRRSSSRTRRNP
jgi:hypothetical protein